MCAWFSPTASNSTVRSMRFHRWGGNYYTPSGSPVPFLPVSISCSVHPRPFVSAYPCPGPPAPTPTAAAPAKQCAPRCPSTSTPVIRRNNSISAGGSRPKREIHPSPSKDLPYADVPKKSRKARAAKDNLNAEQLRFCSKLLGDLHQKSHWNIASPFYEPVGASALEPRTRMIPNYRPRRFRHSQHSNLPQDYQEAHGPIDNAEEVGRARVSKRPSAFRQLQTHDPQLFPLQPRRYAREPGGYRAPMAIRREVEEPSTTQAPAQLRR